MPPRVGKFRAATPNPTFYRTLSFILSTALVILPVLPARAALARSAAGAGRAEALRAAPAPAPLAPSLTATKVDSFPDPDGDGKAAPGETITYAVTVTNNGTDATNVTFNDTVDPNTTLVPGSVRTQPVAAGDSYSVLGNVQISVPDGTSDLLNNDRDPDTGNNSGLTAVAETKSSAQCAGCNNVVISASGAFTYNPPAGYEGTDSFTYTVTDGTQSDTATATLTISKMVWFVDNAAATNGDGRLTSPFNSLAPLNGAGDPDKPGDVIFVHEGSGSYGGGIVLENSQRLVGQGTSLDAALASFGIGVPAHSVPRPAATSSPTLANSGGNVITLGDGNRVMFLNASASAAASSAISGNGTGGTTAVSNVGVGASGSSNGISLTSPLGPVTVSNSSVACGSSGTAVLVSGGAAGVLFNGTSVSQNG
ncbi:MAG TPA: Ig-like domain-containing protein, partial [Pyrinomonadaceae bacterium]